MTNSHSVILSVSQRVERIPLASVMWSLLYAEVRGADSWVRSSEPPAQPPPRQLLPGSGVEMSDAAHTQRGEGPRAAL